jgi:Glycosyl transferase family 2
MCIVAIMAVRNEDWVLGLSLRALLMWCDEVIVGLHACTDQSRDIAEQVVAETKRVRILIQPDEEWREMAHRQALLEIARKRGATHIAYVDADEVLTGDLLPSIRDRVEECGPGRILNLRWLCMPTLETYFASGVWGDNYVDVAFADLPNLHWSASEQAGYEHHHRRPMGQQLVPLRTGFGGGLMHLQFLDSRRLRAKQYLYELRDRLHWGNREPVAATVLRYSQAVHTERLTVATAKPEWWEPYKDLMQHLHLGGEPWQIAECKRLLSENKGIGKGLDDFGLGLL